MIFVGFVKGELHLKPKLSMLYLKNTNPVLKNKYKPPLRTLMHFESI